MTNINVAIVYYSVGGTNEQMAKWAKSAVEELGATARILNVKPSEEQVGEEATSADLEWADAIIFSTPTRFGMMAAEMKAFIDKQGGLWSEGKTVNKVVTAMSSAGNAHGGQEATILSLYTTLMHWGAIIVPPGYTDPVTFTAGGNPYGTTVTVDENREMIEDVEAAVKHQAKRTATIAKQLKQS